MSKVDIRGDNMDNLKQIGSRIRKARKDKSISQIDLADMVQISTSHLSDIENGKTNIGLDIFIRITESLQVSADWLLQSNVPNVKNIQNNELTELLSDCSSAEKQAIIKMATDMKNALRNNK